MPIGMRTRKLPYDAERARRHLRRCDPVLGAIVRAAGPLEMRLHGQPYQSLLRALLYQQLAGAAAAAIERRFLAIYGDRIPEPDELLATGAERLREAGISRQKASYMHSLAEHALNGSLNGRKLARASNDEVVEQVTRVKGVGRWTADMLLMFSLGRPDVLPVGDLGIQNAIKNAYRLDEQPDSDTMLRIAKPWRPYCSAASWYLWRTTDIVTM